jgi:hypothetical protein
VEAEVEAEENAIVDGEATIADLQSEEAAIEKFMVVLDQGIQRGQYSPQTIVLAQEHLQDLQTAFSKEFSPTIPSLEAFGEENLGEYYTAAMESFQGFLKRIRDLQGRLGNGIIEMWKRGGLVRKIESRAASANKNADVAGQKLGALSAAGPIEVSGIPAELSSTGGNLLRGVQRDLQLTTEMATKGLKANERLQTELVGVLNEAVATGGVGKVGPIIAKLAQVKPASPSWPQGAFKGELAGGWKLVAGEVKDGAGTDNRSMIKGFMATAIPSVKREKVERIKAASLTKADLENLLKLAKVYTGIAQAIAKTSGIKAVETLTANKYAKTRAIGMDSSGRSTSAPTSWSEGKELDSLMGSLPVITKQHIAVYQFTAGHALDMAEALIATVRRAL